MLNIKEHTRYKEGNGTVFVFAKRKRRYGKRYSDEQFSRLYTPETPKRTETEEWHRRLKRAIRCMHMSGLWPELMQKFQNCLLMTAEDRKAIYDIWLDRRKLVDGQRFERTEEEQDARLQPFMDTYPFVFSRDEKGHIRPDTDYIYEISDCVLKSMYFGRENKDIKCELKAAIEDRRPWSSGRIRANYDVSVEYDPGKQKGWYSEEYRNCGNGHYYLMLDGSTALFCEND